MTGTAISTEALYDRKAAGLVTRYESLTFEEVHRPILDLLPVPPARVLDVGAGSGRDAAALVRRGYEVHAVEPSAMMRRRAKKVHGGGRITWRRDKLPWLTSLRSYGRRFDLILVSAVWMHVPPPQRAAAMTTLASLLADDGILVLTLRYGRVDPVRRFFHATFGEVTELARNRGLVLVRATPIMPDQLLRPHVQWQTVVFGEEEAKSPPKL